MAGLMVQEGNELQGKETLISVTIEVKQAGYSAGGVRFTIPEQPRSLEATSNFVGTHYLAPFALHGVNYQTDERFTEIVKNMRLLR